MQFIDLDFTLDRAHSFIHTFKLLTYDWLAIKTNYLFPVFRKSHSYFKVNQNLIAEHIFLLIFTDIN